MMAKPRSTKKGLSIKPINTRAPVVVVPTSYQFVPVSTQQQPMMNVWAFATRLWLFGALVGLSTFMFESQFFLHEHDFHHQHQHLRSMMSIQKPPHNKLVADSTATSTTLSSGHHSFGNLIHSLQDSNGREEMENTAPRDNTSLIRSYVTEEEEPGQEDDDDGENDDDDDDDTATGDEKDLEENSVAVNSRQMVEEEAEQQQLPEVEGIQQQQS